MDAVTYFTSQCLSLTNGLDSRNIWPKWYVLTLFLADFLSSNTEQYRSTGLVDNVVAVWEEAIKAKKPSYVAYISYTDALAYVTFLILCTKQLTVTSARLTDKTTRVTFSKTYTGKISTGQRQYGMHGWVSNICTARWTKSTRPLTILQRLARRLMRGGSRYVKSCALIVMAHT